MKNRIFRIAYLLLIYAIFYLPIGILIVYSFNDSKYSIKWNGFTTIWYTKILENKFLIESLWHSLTITTIAASISTIVGLVIAFAIFRYDFHFKKLIDVLINILALLPEIIISVSLLLIFMSLGMELGFITLLISHVVYCLPFTVLVLITSLYLFDKKIIEAAEDLGASEFQIFTKIIIPILKPSIISAWLLAFTLSVDDLVVSFFVTGPDYQTLPIKIFSMVKLGVKPEVNALCALLFALSLLLAFTWYGINRVKTARKPLKRQ